MDKEEELKNQDELLRGKNTLEIELRIILKSAKYLRGLILAVRKSY